MGKQQEPIGVFDSGVGGLSVYRHLQKLLPEENIIYLADQAHVPYGDRTPAEIVQFSRAISHFLLAQPVKMIVVPCNTASAAALTLLRQDFPDVIFVGMEPAVKPAARQTKSGKVGVLATAGTIESDRYGRLMQQYAQDIEVFEDPCPGLVELIEGGKVQAQETELFLRQRLGPLLANDVDTLVLGCTHYPFIRPLLEKIGGEQITIIDPAPAVARQTTRLLQQANLLTTDAAKRSARFITTGEARRFSVQIQQLLGFEAAVETAMWLDKELILADPK